MTEGLKAFLLAIANTMVIGLVIFYLTVAALFAICGEWARAGYWAGAALINFSALRF